MARPSSLFGIRGLAAAIVLIGVAAAEVQAQRLVPIKGALGYQFRGDRWEGFFEREVARSDLPSFEVVSLSRGGIALSQENPAPVRLALSTATVAADSVHLRAVPRYGVPLYRMDAVIGRRDTLVWSLRDVVARYPASLSDLGVVAWFEDSARRVVYVPIVARQSAAAASGARQSVVPMSGDAEIQLVLLSEIDVEDVHIRVTPIRNPAPEAWSTLARFCGAGETLVARIPSRTRALLRVEVRARQYKTANWLALFSFVMVTE